jgi:hypothetical protein
MKPIPRLLMLFSLTVASFVSFVSAQEAKPLAEFAPEDSFLTLSWSQQSSVFDTIDDDVNALEWQGAKESLGKLFEYLAQTSSDESITMLAETYATMLSGDTAAANKDLLEFCPAYQSVLDKSKTLMDEKKFAPAEALLTVNASGFSPVPAATALLRSNDPELSAFYQEMQSTLITCAQESGDESMAITTLDQDGTTLYVVGDGGDFPIVGGSVGDLFFISTNPDTARGIVRKANGSSEANFTTSALYQKAMSKLKPGENNVGMMVDFDALAKLLESFGTGVTNDDPTAEYALTRSVAMLRTLGGFAGNISATSEGLVTESIFATNPAGGDEDLLKMINCTTCKVSSPFLAPDTATSISSAYIPVRELIAYADTWVRGISEASGEPTTLKEVLSDAGVDIDTLLLDWIGSEAHTFVLKPFNTDAGDLLYGLPQVTVIPVSSPEAAQKGLDAMGDTFWELYPALLDSGLSASDLTGMGDVFSNQIAVRPYDYNGTTIHRVQYSFNGNLGYAFIGNYLVLGTPSKAIEKLIDTYQGSRTILDNKDYQAARDRAPDNVTVFGFSHDKPNYQGLADVLQLLNQPLAYGVITALTAAESFAEEYTFEPYSADLEGKTVGETISAADGTLELTLPVSATDESGYIYYYYELGELSPNTEVTLNVLSGNDSFYPYASLIDVTDSMYVAESEYQDDGSYSLTFTPQEGKTYWLEVYGSAPGAFSPYSAYVAEDAKAEPLGVPASLDVAVKPDEADENGTVITYYELTGLKAGDTFEVKLSSADYYPSIGLVDTDTGEYVATGTYQDDGSYTFTHTAEEGKTYWLEVYGTIYEETPASYTLEVNTGAEPFVAADIPLTMAVSSEAAPEVTEDGTEVAIAVAPTFAELLDAADILPQLVRVIADHAATTESHSTIDGDTVYSRSVTYFKW